MLVAIATANPSCTSDHAARDQPSGETPASQLDAGAGEGSACAPDPRASDTIANAGASAIDEEITAALGRHHVAGVSVAVVKRGMIVFAKGYGLARPTGEPETARSVHLIASASKPMTAVAAMQLVEIGKLRLDEDVDVSLADLGLRIRNPRFPTVPITLRMLLTHTASIGDSTSSFDSTWYSNGDSPISIREFVAGYFTPGSPYAGGAEAFLDHAPGTASCYSNMGVALASLLIERASQTSFADYCRTNIFLKLGMLDSSFRLEDQCDLSRLAYGMRHASGQFERDDNSGVGQPEGHPELASGMLRTTAVDMGRFVAAMANGGELDGARILAPASVAEIRKRQLSPTMSACNARVDPAEQGLLSYYSKDAAGEYFGHAGGMNGVGTDAFFRTTDGTGFVVLGNASYDAWINDVEVALLTHAARL